MQAHGGDIFCHLPEEPIKFKTAIGRAIEEEEQYRQELSRRIENI